MHRQRSHDAGHAQAAQAITPAAAPHDPMIPGNAPALIAASGPLHELCNQLRAAGSFAYDSEFIGENTYHPVLCVIQTATFERVTLVDPLTDLDLREFWRLIVDPDVVKIVHSGFQDLEPAYRHLGRPPQNIFDVQIAAAFAGLAYPAAMGKLAEALLGERAGGGSVEATVKFSQWDRRPLSPLQLHYAANDVRFLPLMRHVLIGRLQSIGNLAWALEECQSLCDADQYRHDAAPQRVRVRGASRLTGLQRVVLGALAAWRAAQARIQNLPPRSLIRDEVLVSLACASVATPRDLDQVRGLPRPVRHAHSDRIVQIIRAAQQQAPPTFKRRSKRQEQEYRDRVQHAWQQVERLCQPRSIAPAIVTSKKELGQLLSAVQEGDRSTAPIPRDSRLLRGWRCELLAPIIDKLLDPPGHSVEA